jgi:hypothetical protein
MLRVVIGLLGLMQAAPAGDLKSVAWMEGAWKSNAGGVISEEHWTAPNENHMLGMYRMQKAGKVVFTELLAMELSESGPVMYIRHFGPPGLIAREEKDAPVKMLLVKSEPNTAVFERDNKETVITYRREGDTLTCVVERKGRPALTFKMQRAER